MKKLLTISLALVMALSLAATASAGSPDIKDSYANIEFAPGQLVINPDPDPDEVGFNPFTLEFGRRNVPIRREIYRANGESAGFIGTSGIVNTPTTEGASLLPAGDHTLEDVGALVTDNRATAQLSAWKFSVKMSAFEESTSVEPDFNADLYLYEGVGFTNSASATIGGDAVNDDMVVLSNNGGTAGDFLVATDNTDVQLIEAKITAGKGSHGIQFKHDKIELALGTDFEGITDAEYVSTMTWTLQAL